MQTSFFSGNIPSTSGASAYAKLIVGGSEDGKVFLWDADTMQVKQQLEGHSGVVLATACNPDETKLQIASAGADSAVKLWKWSPESGSADDPADQTDEDDGQDDGENEEVESVGPALESESVPRAASAPTPEGDAEGELMQVSG
jgi:WD40 repeat protein